MITYFNIPAWKIPWTEKPGGLQSMEMAVLDRTEHAHLCFSFFASGVAPWGCCWSRGMWRLPGEKERYLPTCGWKWVLVLWWARPCLGAWSRGDCGLRTLGSLPAVGGSLSPPSLSFDLKCPPALGPAGCSVGPGLGAKMSASRGAHADECPPQYVCHQCSCRQAESQPLTPTCLETQRPAGRSGPGLSNYCFCPWSLHTRDFVCNL